MVKFEELKKLEGKQVIVPTIAQSVYIGTVYNVREPSEEQKKNDRVAVIGFDYSRFFHTDNKKHFEKNDSSDFPVRANDVFYEFGSHVKFSIV